VPAVQLSPTYVAWDGYEQDMAEFTAGLKASPSSARYFAEVRGWLDENSMSIDADARSRHGVRPRSRCHSRGVCRV
jgi:hypothetical protein